MQWATPSPDEVVVCEPMQQVQCAVTAIAACPHRNTAASAAAMLLYEQSRSCTAFNLLQACH
jgi:hypothetical protein